MRAKATRTFVGDFETTVYEGQTDTEVWASGLVELNTEDVQIFHSIGDTFDYLKSIKENVIVYYHNLKFDGCFWLSFLMLELGYKQAVEKTGDGQFGVKFLPDKEMPDSSFKYSISDMGQWYMITIRTRKQFIYIKDSLKLLPFSLKRIGKAFKTKHQKLDMEYEGFRYAGCTITDAEREYLANDLLVIKEALEIMFAQGHKKLTIASCCLSEYKNLVGEYQYQDYFPQLYDIPIDPEIYDQPTAGDYIRKAYKGGWCYLVKGKENTVVHNGTTADVNSLYPSMMSSESGNKYPVGSPTFWQGDYIPEEALSPNRYYFVRIKTRFYLKPNKLPCIQIKGTFLYKATEWLETSDIYDQRTGEYYPAYIGLNGQVTPAEVTLTLTMTDYALIKEHYDLVDMTILDGCYFDAEIGIFDIYIEKYKKIKIESTGAMRELAKMFLNNLYGKMASSTNSSFKYAYIKDDYSIGFVEVREFEKEAGYIAAGAAITSYARNFTIRHAQKNYHGKDKHGFIYADTDSIHCDLPPDQIVGVNVHPTNFCCWKLESCWDTAIFVRQKTYIEHIISEDMNPVEHPFYNVKCAGLPERSKELFTASLLCKSREEWETVEEWDDYPPDQQEFILTPRTIEDFKVGLSIPGKLLPKRIRGGVLLCETTYEMR